MNNWKSIWSIRKKWPQIKRIKERGLSNMEHWFKRGTRTPWQTKYSWSTACPCSIMTSPGRKNSSWTLVTWKMRQNGTPLMNLSCKIDLLKYNESSSYHFLLGFSELISVQWFYFSFHCCHNETRTKNYFFHECNDSPILFCHNQHGASSISSFMVCKIHI